MVKTGLIYRKSAKTRKWQREQSVHQFRISAVANREAWERKVQEEAWLREGRLMEGWMIEENRAYRDEIVATWPRR